MASSAPPVQTAPDPAGAPVKRRPSKALAVIYFFFGLTLAATTSMVALTLLRPLMGALSEGALRLIVVAPLVLGVAYGLRLAWVGHRERLTLGRAIKRSLRVGGAEPP